MAFIGLGLVLLMSPALVLPRSMALGIRPYKAILESVIVASTGILFLFILVSATGESLGVRIASVIHELIKISVDNQAFIDIPLLQEMSNSEIKSYLINFSNIMIDNFPGFLIILSGLLSYFLYIGISKVMEKRVKKVRRLPLYKNFSWPKQGIWAWIAIYLISLFISRDFPEGGVVLSNVNMLMEFYFAFQGGAVVFFLVAKKKWPTAVAIIIVPLFMIVRIFRMGLFILGLLDLMMNLRNRMSGIEA